MDERDVLKEAYDQMRAIAKRPLEIEPGENWDLITVAEVHVGDVIWLRENESFDEPYKGVVGCVLGRNDSDPILHGRGKNKVETSWVTLLIRQHDDTVVEFTSLIGTNPCWRRGLSSIDEPTDIT